MGDRKAILIFQVASQLMDSQLLMVPFIPKQNDLLLHFLFQGFRETFIFTNERWGICNLHTYGIRAANSSRSPVKIFPSSTSRIDRITSSTAWSSAYRTNACRTTSALLGAAPRAIISLMNVSRLCGIGTEIVDIVVLYEIIILHFMISSTKTPRCVRVTRGSELSSEPVRV